MKRKIKFIQFKSIIKSFNTQFLIIFLKVIIIATLSILISKTFFEINSLYFSLSYIEYILFISGWISSVSFLILLSLKNNSIGKIFIVILLALLGLTVDICYSTLNDTLSAEAISLFWNERSYFTEATITYWNILIIPLIRFIIFIFVILYPVKPSIKIKNSLLVIIFALSFIPTYFLSSKPNGNGIDGLQPHIAPIPYLYHLSLMHFNYKKITRKDVEINITHNSLSDNIVLIIDESVRGDFIDLNYNRGTTPHLIKFKNRIINFGLALSSYNRSNGSHALLRMGINPNDFISKDGCKILFSNPLIWQYAHKAGYKTYYIDAQKSTYQNYMDSTEAKFIDSIIWIKNSEGNFWKDHILAKKINQILRVPGKKFIIGVKDGVHFHYENRYPNKECIFEPVMTLGIPTNDRLKLINSYRNAIRWNTDIFFKILLENPNLNSTIIIYTSDHGQNLFDAGTNDVNLRHGTNKNSLPQEVIVPLLLITDNVHLKEKLNIAAKINFNICSHYQIFPTILYFMGYDKNKVKEKYYLTLFDKMDHLPGFSNGNLRFGKRNLIEVSNDLTSYIDPEIEHLITLLQKNQN